jgi:hypothetical protein
LNNGVTIMLSRRTLLHGISITEQENICGVLANDILSYEAINSHIFGTKPGPCVSETTLQN